MTDRPSSEIMSSRRKVLAALGSLGLFPFAALAQTPLYRTDILDKKRANARGRFESVASKSKKTDANVQALLAGIDRARLTTTLQELTAFRTRWSLSPRLAGSRDWIAKQFTDFGYPSARVQKIEAKLPNGTVFDNVLCIPERLDQGFILVCAHYDSISQKADLDAPGADDNASGVAAMLEAARLFSKIALKRGIMFAAFGGEEQGLHGSHAIANLAAQDRWPVDVVINLDMVGYLDPARPTNIVVEYDQGNVDPKNDAAAKAFGLQMAQVAADYTALTVEHTDIWNSDYMPFEAKGYPCIGLYDGAADSSFYHSTLDTVGVVDLARLVDITRMICAFAAIIAELKIS